MKNHVTILILLIITTFGCFNIPTKKTNKQTDPPPPDNGKITEEVKRWLASPEETRESLDNLSFAKESLTKSQSNEVIRLLHSDKQSSMLKKYEIQWNNRILIYQDYKMPFFYQKYGDEPVNGRSLFISLHGGGGAPPKVNDQQYENQKHLYDTVIKNINCMYLAPRAPTNTWNLWHQSHIDEFLNIIIQMAVIKENVNPNKVYLLGYSAGGDGVYQLAPRLADRLAAASMMAGHPNNASPISLRNLPFAIHMGALDGAYKRNKVALKWKNRLHELQNNDPKGYIHDVQLHPDLGHWMELKDSIAIPWMSNYKRNTIPQKVVWKQSSRHHSNFYWVKTPDTLIKTNGDIRVEYNRTLNEINIEENYAENIQLLLNDEMLDLDEPIIIKYQGNIIHQGKFDRSILNIYESLSEKGDSGLAFSCKVTITNNDTISKN